MPKKLLYKVWVGIIIHTMNTTTRLQTLTSESKRIKTGCCFVRFTYLYG